jgi:hypothetical protein
MRRKQPTQLLLIAALALVLGGVILSAPASGAPLIVGQKAANRAVRGLIRSDLVRAEIVTYDTGEVGDYRVDRGTVRKIRGRWLTVAERDGSVLRVRLSSATRIRIDNLKSTRKRIRRGMRVALIRPGGAAPSWLYVTRRSPDRSIPKIKALLSNNFLRAEVVSWTSGDVLDSRTDTGVIESVDDVSLTLQEDDGTIAEMQLDDATEVWIDGMALGTGDLVAGMRATTIGSGDGLVGQIWAQGAKKSRLGKK